MQTIDRPFRSLALVATALLCAGASALAAPRPDVTQMACAQAQALIARQGAVVVTTGQRTYKRFVSDGRFCDAGERHLHPAFTPTADAQSCRIGYTCESWSLYFPDRD